jgi:hypothetical protein
MNPAIVGALIGAIPGTLAAALATWASIQASRTNLQQTELTLAGDHARWIREKRADIYVEMLQFILEADRQRNLIIYPRADVAAVKTVCDDAEKKYNSSSMVELFAKAEAYVSKEAANKFNVAWGADQAVWRSVKKQLESETFVVDDELREAMTRAANAANSFSTVASSDLQKAGKELGLRPSFR